MITDIKYSLPILFCRVVQKIQNKLAHECTDKEYLAIDGLAELKKATQKLIFGAEFAAIKEHRIASAQSISGTGALRVAAEFIKSQIPQVRDAYLSSPSWTNHFNIFSAAGFAIKEYAYWDGVGY